MWDRKGKEYGVDEGHSDDDDNGNDEGVGPSEDGNKENSNPSTCGDGNKDKEDGRAVVGGSRAMKWGSPSTGSPFKSAIQA